MLKKEMLQGMEKRYPKIGPTLIMRFANNGDGIADLMKLWMHVRCQRVAIEFRNPIVVAAVVQSRNWGMDLNRNVEIRFPLGAAMRDSFTLETLENLRSIESLKFANQNPLNALVTGRQKKQQDAADEIIEECIDMEIVREIESWGMNIHYALDTSIEGLPGIRIVVCNDSEKAFDLLLDGWSGCILVNDKVQDVAYSNGKQVREIIYRTLTEYLES